MSLPAFAQDIGLTNVDQTDFKKIIGDFSANSLHTTVSGAGTLGDIFGFELGVVGGVTNTPEINKLVQEVSPSNEAKRIPHGELIGLLTVPLGFTVEAGFIPKVGSDSFKYNTWSLAAKWTPTEFLFELPVDLAVKAYVTEADIEANDTVSGVATKYEFKNSLVGVTGYVSKDFIFAAPYFGFGMVNAKGDLTATGTAVFDPSYTSSNSASEKDSSTVIIVGSEFKLLVLKLGVEYTRLFDTDRYTAKLSFFF
jgi:hypothetical protein